MAYTKDKIESAVKAKGYVWFEGAKDFDVNIVGVRNSDTGNAVTNAFDDTYHCYHIKKMVIGFSKSGSSLLTQVKKE
jgi:hypothetical protein